MDRLNTPKTLILGSGGLVGSAVARRFPLATAVGRGICNLQRRLEVEDVFCSLRPERVVLCAAKVGGIFANQSQPVDFLLNNLEIQNNVIRACHEYGVRKLVFLGSNCIYPRETEQPIRPEQLLSGPLEPTNQPYALAKIAGIELCRAYKRQHGLNAVSLMPCNLYGPHDNYREGESHVLPALLQRFHRVKMNGTPTVKVFGNGNALREFLHADDFAAAVETVLLHDTPDIVNVGSGHEVSIAELAQLVAIAVGFEGSIEFDPAAPNGTPRKLLDSSVLRGLGWSPKFSLPHGLAATYASFKKELLTGEIRC